MKSCYKAGLIRVITLPDAEAAGIHGRLIMEMFPNMTVETKCIPDQPDGLHSVESKNAAIPKIIEVAQSFKDIDVLIVSCADDPAVPELKNIVNVPVIGAGSSVAAIARRFGTKVGILGITDYAPQPYLEILGDDLINLGKPDGVETTLDLVTEPGFKAVEKLAMRLKWRRRHSTCMYRYEHCRGGKAPGKKDRLTCDRPRNGGRTHGILRMP